jgi:PAS domain S-box-containing protein
MKLSTQLTLAIVGVVLVTAAALGLFTYQSVEQAVLPGQLERAELGAQLLANKIQSFVGDARSDVAGFRSTAVQGIVRASLAGGIDPQGGKTLDQWRAQLAGRIVGLLTAKPAYTQFRLIGAADDGREIVRVDRSGPGGAIRVVPDAELQQKGGRDYFKRAIGLAPGAVFVSDIDLNREHGAIETPHIPVLRVAVPITAPDDAPFGIVIINLDLRPVFDLVRNAATADKTLYVVNARGDFLVHPGHSREFGFEFGKSFQWQDEFPGFAAALKSAPDSADVFNDADANRVGIATASVRLAGGPRIAVIETIPFAALVAPAEAAERSSLIVGFLAVLAALALAFFVARSLTRPLVQMTAAVEGFGDSRPMQMPVESGGEIGVLSRAFARIFGEVRDKTAALEKEVERHRRTWTELERHADRERLYSAAVQSSFDAIVTKTLDGIITGWNPAAELLFGFTAEEAIGNSIEIIVPEERRAELHEILARIRKGQIVDHHDTIRRTKSGKTIDISLSVSPIKSPSGAIIGACKIARDVTEEKLAEEKFKLAVEACPGGMLMADRTGLIVMANTEVEKLFGYRREELIGQSVELLIPERVRAQHFEDRCSYAAKPEARRIGLNRDLSGRRKDGSEFPVEVALNPIHSRRGLLILSVIVDITERQRLDRLKSEFVSTVSHELRTPLTSISGSLGLLMGTAAGELPERALRLLWIAQSNSQRLVKLVNDILDIEKLESGQLNFKFRLVDLRPLVEQAIEANAGFADTYLVRLRHEIGAEGEVWVDPDRLSQVITNLISNAIKFSPPDGEVVVAVERRGNAWRLSVRDQGEGIPAEFKSHIFERFAQADGTNTKKKGGTGLGLSIVKEIVGRLGGEVGFSDAPGGGTVFYVDLPGPDPSQAVDGAPRSVPVLREIA